MLLSAVALLAFVAGARGKCPPSFAALHHTLQLPYCRALVPDAPVAGLGVLSFELKQLESPQGKACVTVMSQISQTAMCGRSMLTRAMERSNAPRAHMSATLGMRAAL